MIIQGLAGIVVLLAGVCVYLITQVNKENERAMAAEKKLQEAEERPSRQLIDSEKRVGVLLKRVAEQNEQIRRMSER